MTNGVWISADDPRSIHAIEIAATADKWQSYDVNGTQVFKVPSQTKPDHSYLVCTTRCSCTDFERGVQSGNLNHACKHILAVRLHLELAKAQKRLHLRVVA